MKEKKQNLQKNPQKQNKTKETKTKKHYAQHRELNIILFRFSKPTLLSFYSNVF